ncbi:hypothetical protein LR48_Vigan475s000300 [Vigna angularis]|uniref:Uncharacterized protein n=1 Tax=Phaseolus angularis TaxID=3914 RepID=A0A0L9TC65_PHAAN|nr:hypothetical protein LR48_Vigan475s000300 [Vigna angularis]
MKRGRVRGRESRSISSTRTFSPFSVLLLLGHVVDQLCVTPFIQAVGLSSFAPQHLSSTCCSFTSALVHDREASFWMKPVLGAVWTLLSTCFSKKRKSNCLLSSQLSREFGERSEEGERWNQKRHQKVQKKKPQLPLSGSLPLSGTQEFTGDPLRGKMTAEGKKPTHALTAERNEANSLSSTPLKEDLGCSGYLFTFLGFYLSFFHYYSSSFTMNMEAIRTRSKITAEPLLEGLDESRRRRKIRTSRQLFPPPETLLQPSPQGSDHSTENMENNNIRRTLADYTNIAGPQHFNSIARPRVNAANMEVKPALIQLVKSNQFNGLSHES